MVVRWEEDCVLGSCSLEESGNISKEADGKYNLAFDVRGPEITNKKTPKTHTHPLINTDQGKDNLKRQPQPDTQILPELMSQDNKVVGREIIRSRMLNIFLMTEQSGDLLLLGESEALSQLLPLPTVLV